MKHLYLIGGPMGVGKSSVSALLQKRLGRSVYLDGDWCWNMEPFVVCDETKAMVLDNICHLLGNFLGCSLLDNIIFCWVLDQEEILQEILRRLGPQLEGCQVKAVSLLCSPEKLQARLEGDVARGLRQPDIIPRSLERLWRYDALPTIKLDTSRLSPAQVAEALSAL